MEGLKDLVAKIKGGASESSKAVQEDIGTSKNWFDDRYQWVLVQRNVLFFTLVVCACLVLYLTFSVSFIKSMKSIEPFVIEIEPKTGVPTVVDPLTSVVYSADEAIKRYFVWHYIKTREEYYFQTYKQSMKEISLMSTSEVYSVYRRSMDESNLQSPYNLYAQHSFRSLELKSLIFQEDNRAQVRARFMVNGGGGNTMDKVILIQFSFSDLNMSDEKRLINPLGFTVNLYKIDDERV